MRFRLILSNQGTTSKGDTLPLNYQYELFWDNLSALNEQPLSENDLTEVCKKVYKNGYNDEQEKDFQKGINNTTINEFENNWIAGHWENWIEDAIESDNKKIEILCGNLVDEYDSLLKEGRYIEASQLLIQVYFYQLHKTTFSKDTKRNIITAYDFDYNNLTGYKIINEEPYVAM